MKPLKTSKSRKIKAIDYLYVHIAAGFLTALLGTIISTMDAFPFLERFRPYAHTCEIIFHWAVCFYIFYCLFGVLLLLCTQIFKSASDAARFKILKKEYLEKETEIKKYTANCSSEYAD